jgi:hypothetical protein
LRENPDRINWQHLSSNPNAIDLLREHPEEINWLNLSSNPNIYYEMRKGAVSRF